MKINTAGDLLGHAWVLKAAQRLLDEASNGEPWAVKESADRLHAKSQEESVIETHVDCIPQHLRISFVTPYEKLRTEKIINLAIEIINNKCELHRYLNTFR